MEDSEVLLNELLSQEMDEAVNAMNEAASAIAMPPIDELESEEGEKKKKSSETHTQWALGGNGKFMPVGSTVERLTAGIYEPFATPGMWGLEQISIASDGIYALPDMATDIVMEEVKKFWDSEALYRKHHLLYKRGIILWGVPGAGKSVTIKLLMQELVRRNGLVVIANNVNLTILCLKAIRRIEPKRNLIVVLEDIDEIIQHNGEAQVLSLLDGESSIDNILSLASTNYPERLGARIINRPSRFDRRIYVGLPEESARRVYFEQATNKGLSQEQLDQWVKDTKDMSIAHLRELIAAVYCLDQPYADVIERLQNMAVAPKGESGFKQGGSVGFASQAASNKRSERW